MNAEQYERWADFARRMARTHYGKRSRGRQVGRQYVRAASPEWIAESVEIVLRECLPKMDRIEDWDGNGDDMNGRRRGLVCVSDLFCDVIYWGEALDEEPEMHDANGDGPTAAWEAWEEMWAQPVNCCVRAGLDLAGSPSAGVVGFTVGDLRRMYPEGIPSWITGQYKGKDGMAVDFAAKADDAGVLL